MATSANGSAALIRSRSFALIVRDVGFWPEDQLLRIAVEAVQRPLDIAQRLLAIDGEVLVVAQARSRELIEVLGQFAGPAVEVLGQGADRLRGFGDLAEHALAV